MAENLEEQLLSDIRSFETFSQRVWPRIRFLCARYVAPRCRNCTISSRVPYVRLTHGVCNLCEAHLKLRSREEELWNERYTAHQRAELDELLKGYQGKASGRYDALILFSGGKDSVYMLSRIRKEYPGLRLLLTTWNNGFYSKLALDLAHAISTSLDLDHITFKPRSAVYKTLYRYTLQHVENKGSYQTVDRLDGSLNQFLGFWYAYHMNIPLVLAGVDFAQELIMQFHTYYQMPFEDMCSRTLVDRMERRSGFRIADIFTPEEQELFWDGTGKDPGRIPRYILPLVAWRPDKGAIKRELEQEGLMAVADASPIITNNQVLSVMSAIDIRTIGYCSFEPEFSEMIRHRENDPVYWKNAFEALEFVVKKKFILQKMVDKVLRKLDLTLADVGLSELGPNNAQPDAL